KADSEEQDHQPDQRRVRVEEDEVDLDLVAVLHDERDHVREDEDEADENRVQPRLPVRKLAAAKDSAKEAHFEASLSRVLSNADRAWNQAGLMRGRERALSDRAIGRAGGLGESAQARLSEV